jgi:tRNA modification GTPase
VRHGRAFDSSGKLVDDILITVMRGPDTYTGEDVVELSCHGGPLASRLVLEALLDAGARPAEPGEFTKRAFLNNKMDLAQAEAVAEVVAARTRRALDGALSQLGGAVSGRLRQLRSTVVDALADLEARLDFPDDVPEDLAAADLSESLRDAAAQLELLVSERAASARLSAGARVPIVGRPNAGKSSLLNALLRRSRAIVNPLPGTTRDTIEEEFDLQGIPVNLIDTAGLRNAGEEIEEEGVKRSKDEIRRADLVIHVVDASAPDHGADCDILDSIRGKPALVAVNKIDITSPERARAALAGSPPANAGPARAGCPAPAGRIVFAEVSARTGAGIEALEGELARTILGTQSDMDDARSAGLRHADCLRTAAASIERALSGLADGAPEELVAFELREAVRQLGLITGETVGPDVLDSIFSRFCVGK